MKRVLFFVLVLFAAANAYADEEELQKEYDSLKKRLGAAEEEYWKSRYRLIELKQKAADGLASLENEYNDLMKSRSIIKEDLLSISAEKKITSDTIDNFKIRDADLSSSLTQKIMALQARFKRNYPFISPVSLARLKEIKVKGIKKNMITPVSELIDLVASRVRDSEKCEILHRDIITKEGVPKKGNKLRFGYIFFGYQTDDGLDAGMILRSRRISSGAYKWHEDISSSHGDLISHAVDQTGGDSGFAMLPVDVMQSMAAVKSYEGGGSALWGLLDWFRSGGVVMYAILMILLYALYIIGEKVFVYRKNHINADSLMDSVKESFGSGDYEAVLDICGRKEGPLSRMIRSVMSEYKNLSRDEAYHKMEEALLHETPVIEKHLSTLKTLGALGPLLGLLGTVTGMISLFDVITLYGTGDPKLLAGGIAEALVTTEFGLIVAVPALLSHRILLNLAENIISDMHRYGLTILNLYRKSSGKKGA